MTREEILNMKAGPELDALVAEHVMEWTVTQHEDYWMAKRQDGVKLFSWQWKPSQDIEAAWDVMERMKDVHSCVWYHSDVETGETGWWCMMASPYADVLSDTAPLAICLCALIASLENKKVEA